jgi:hypothetical protein
MGLVTLSLRCDNGQQSGGSGYTVGPITHRSSARQGERRRAQGTRMTRRPGDSGDSGDKGRTGTKGARVKPVLRLVGDRPETAGPAVLVGEVLAPRRPKTRGPVLPIGVTAKEEAFCRAVAGGASQSEAYRRSHDAGDMNQDTCSRQAVRVASRDRVAARIDQLLAEGQGSALHDRAKARAWALERLQHEAETAETDGARVGAISLIMRHHALLTDRVEQEQVETRDSSQLETELRQRLERLLKPTG